MIQIQTPTLRTIRMVEETMKKMDSAFTLADLKRALPRQVNHNALKEIIAYLEEAGRIAFGSKGMTYLSPPSPRLLEMMRRGREL